MTSELRVTTLSNATGDGPATLTKQSAAKFFIDVSQDFSTIQASLNISSLDDDGTGDGGLNYTNNFSSANYAPSISTDDRGATSGSSQGDFTNGTKGAGGVDFEVYYVFSTANRTNYDMAPYLTGHGDLA